MKRSTNLKLTLMAAAIPAALTGCDPGPATGAVLASASECASHQEVPREQCETAYAQALSQHEQVAPRFESSSDCNEQFGNCSAISDDRGGVNWIPPMGGFLLGYAMAGGFDANRSRDCNRNPGQPACRNGYVVTGWSPLYREYRSGDYYKPNGDLASSRAGTVRGSAGYTTAPTRAITVSRSGFGSSSAARSSFGGGRGFGG